MSRRFTVITMRYGDRSKDWDEEDSQARRTLRKKCSQEVSTAVTWPRVTSSLWWSLLGMARGLITGYKKPYNPMCTNYGHVVPPSWQGEYPRCSDCGFLVTDPSMLRKASPR